MILHRNAYGMATAVARGEELVGKDDVVLLWLPLAHNFGRFLCLSGVSRGFTIAFVADPQRSAEALPHIRPTLLPSVPRVFEKVYEATRAAFAEQHGTEAQARRLGAPRRPPGKRAPPEGKELPVGLAIQHRLADRLVYSKVKQRLGGRVRLAVSGAAPLSRRGARVLPRSGRAHPRGLRPVRVHLRRLREPSRPLPVRHRRPALPNMEARLAEDGELLLRGPTVFAGYYKDEQATREAVDEEGWLHTGDVAEIDADGFIQITDRKKDILVTAGGKKVAPQNLENLLKGSKYVSQALVVGDRRPYIAALVALDEEAIGRGRTSTGFLGTGRALPPPGGRARAGRRRRRQPRTHGLRADQALRDPAARLLSRRGRGHADAQAPPTRRRAALRRARSTSCTPERSPARGSGGRRRTWRRTSRRSGSRS